MELIRGNKFLDKRGRLTAYAFTCGYIEPREDCSLAKDDHANFYIVKGWKKGTYSRETTMKLKEARKILVKKEW
jgi:hypothetical protein